MVENLEERRIIARHEAGHAVVHFTCQLLPPLYQVSILPRNHSPPRSLVVAGPFE